MSEPIWHGGPAFPVSPVRNENGDIQYGHNGMTMRDYFAAAAINEVGWYNNINQSAIMAYEIADAMLKAREGVK